MAKASLREKQTEDIRITLKLLLDKFPEATVRQKREALLKLWGEKKRTGKRWELFQEEALAVLGERLVPHERPRVIITETSVTCEWCADLCKAQARTPGCPMCYPARRQFAEKNGGGAFRAA